MARRERMTRCNCQEIEFRLVSETARNQRNWDLEGLCRAVDCGNICTACRCDLKCYLDECCLGEKLFGCRGLECALHHLFPMELPTLRVRPELIGAGA